MVRIAVIYNVKDVFWLGHRITNGNEKFMISKFMQLSGIVASSLWWYVLWIILDLGYLATLYGTFIILIVNTFILITFDKTSQFIDNFCIRFEIKLILIAITIQMTFFMWILFIFIDWNSITHTNIFAIYDINFNLFGSFESYQLNRLNDIAFVFQSLLSLCYIIAFSKIFDFQSLKYYFQSIFVNSSNNGEPYNADYKILELFLLLMVMTVFIGGLYYQEAYNTSMHHSNKFDIVTSGKPLAIIIFMAFLDSWLVVIPRYMFLLYFMIEWCCIYHQFKVTLQQFSQISYFEIENDWNHAIKVTCIATSCAIGIHGQPQQLHVYEAPGDTYSPQSSNNSQLYSSNVTQYHKISLQRKLQCDLNIEVSNTIEDEYSTLIKNYTSFLKLLSTRGGYLAKQQQYQTSIRTTATSARHCDRGGTETVVGNKDSADVIVDGGSVAINHSHAGLTSGAPITRADIDVNNNNTNTTTDNTQFNNNINSKNNNEKHVSLVDTLNTNTNLNVMFVDDADGLIIDMRNSLSQDQHTFTYSRQISFALIVFNDRTRKITADVIKVCIENGSDNCLSLVLKTLKSVDHNQGTNTLNDIVA